jgi:hypothetical protein
MVQIRLDAIAVLIEAAQELSHFKNAHQTQDRERAALLLEPKGGAMQHAKLTDEKNKDGPKTRRWGYRRNPELPTFRNNFVPVSSMYSKSTVFVIVADSISVVFDVQITFSLLFFTRALRAYSGTLQLKMLGRWIFLIAMLLFSVTDRSLRISQCLHCLAARLLYALGCFLECLGQNPVSLPMVQESCIRTCVSNYCWNRLRV